MWQGPLEPMDEYRFRIPRSYREDMKEDGILFSSGSMIDQIKKDQACEQIANVAGSRRSRRSSSRTYLPEWDPRPISG